ncbi:MAG: hypothetical protein ACK6BG_10745 [Cyanobacteriota bacterium]
MAHRPAHDQNRYSNGKVAVEQLWQLFNPGDTSFQASMRGGTNHAVGGSTSGQENDVGVYSALFNGLGMASQLSAHAMINPTFDASTTLFYVSAFPNDVFYYLNTGKSAGTYTGSSGTPTTLNDLPILAAANIRGTVEALILSGAKNVLVANSPDLDKLPFFSGNPLQADMTRNSDEYNTLLATEISAVASAKPQVSLRCPWSDWPFPVLETQPAATDLDLISFLRSIPDTRMQRGSRIPAWCHSLRRPTLLLILCLGFFPAVVRAQPVPLEVEPTATSGPPQPQAPAATPSLPAAASGSPAGAPVKKSDKIGHFHDNLRRSKAVRAAVRGANSVYDRYSDLKTLVGKEFGLSWSVDVSYLQQWGWPKGGSPSGQFLAVPTIDWTFLKGEAFGEGSLQASFIASRYLTKHTAATVSRQLGLITAINDYPFDQNIFSQLSYTQVFPGHQLLVTIGQFPFSKYDGNQYLNNQQQNFNSYIFSQNGSATYPNAGLGAFTQLNLSKTVHIAAGLQNASDISGASLTTRDFGRGGYACFTYLQWTPQWRGLASAQYSFLYYHVPTVQEQPRSSGWSRADSKYQQAE